MVAWSGFLRSASHILLKNNAIKTIQPHKNGTISRLMSEHREFQMNPSRWSWNKTKDLLHLYICVAAIPIGLGILYVNIFIGPATLTPIPEGYEPKRWEYYKHPISRFISRYVTSIEQMEYEKYLHHIWSEYEVQKCRELEAKVKSLMKERIDYQAYYYQPFTNAKYIRKEAQLLKDNQEIHASAID